MSREPTKSDLDSALHWTLKNYRLECSGLMGVKRFGAIAEAIKSFVVYNRSRLAHYTALGK